MPPETEPKRRVLKILVTGGGGLLAHSISKQFGPGFDLVLCESKEFDLTDRQGMARQLEQHQPEVVINTAAYNFVDRCEQERALSWAVNAAGPEILAGLCKARSCRMIHFSSDYVFDGAKTVPYVESDRPNPINHYGAGKLYGETAVLNAAAENLVLRTSWLFGPHPKQTKSFVHAVVRQARAGAILKVTTDQTAAPTYAPDLGSGLKSLVVEGATGLFHAVNDGALSRYQWAVDILASARDMGILTSPTPIEPVQTSHFGTSMRRPTYTVLSNEKLARALRRPLGSWRRGLEETLQTLRGASC